MDLDGIDAAFLYPSLGLFTGAVQEPHLSASVCRAYNRWLADYSRPIPTASSAWPCCRASGELAIVEMRYARTSSACGRASCAPTRTRTHAASPAYEPFWAEHRRSDFAIGLHRGQRQQRLCDRRGGSLREPRGTPHHLAHDGNDAACLSVIWAACVTAPGCVSVLESGVAGFPAARPHGPALEDRGFNDTNYA